MKRNILLFTSVFLMSLILMDSTFAIGCGTISAPGAYIFTADVTDPDTCIRITTSGVTLTGGAGHKIRYSKYSRGYGVLISPGLNNVNIIGLDMEQVNSSISSSYGIYAPGLTSSNIQNNKIKTIDYRGYGMYLLSSSDSNTISGNQITTTGTYGYGIYLSSGDSNTISGNTITTAGSSAYGVYLSSSDSNPLSGNRITTSGGSAYGVYLSSSDSNPLSGNIITTYAGNGHGIYLRSSRNSVMTGNHFDTDDGYAIYIAPTTTSSYYDHTIGTTNTEQGKPIHYYYSTAADITGLSNIGQLYIADSPGITIDNINGILDGITIAGSSGVTTKNSIINTGSQYSVKGIYLYSSDTNTLQSNDITTGGTYASGIFLQSSDGSTIQSNPITTSGSYASGIYLLSSDGSTIDNNPITTYGSYGYGIYLYSSGNSLITNNPMNTYNAYAIYINPTTTAFYYNHDIDTTNTEQGKLIHYYYSTATDITGLSDIGQLYVANSNGITIDNINGIKDGITLAMTDNSVVSGSTINTASQADVRGIYLHSSSNSNNIMLNTITVAGYGTEGIYLSSSPSNTIQDNTVTASNTYSHGIYLSSSGNSGVSDNTVRTSGTTGHGIYLYSSGSSSASDNDIRTTGTYGSGIVLSSSDDTGVPDNTILTSGTTAYGIYIQSSDNADTTGNTITTSGTTASGILLDGSVDSYIADNVLSTGGDTAHGIYLDMSSLNADISNNTVATSNTNANGIYLYTSGSGNISDNFVTTANSNSNGICLYSSGNSIIPYNDITTSGADSHGIYLRSSDTNRVSSNTVRTTSGAGSGSRAAYIHDSDSNILQDNIFSGQGANNFGLYIDGSYNNNVTGGSILGILYDVSLGSAGTTNNFTDTGLSISGTIQFRDITSWFNYNNESSDSIWLRTRSSLAADLERTILTWDNMLMKWTETPTPSVLDMTYEVRGLMPSMNYAVFQTSGGFMTYINTYTSDLAGTISFSVTLDGITTIEINGDTTPPLVTVINYPDPAISDANETFEVTCDDGPTGTGCDKTTISTSHYTCVVDHQAIPPETNCTMDLTGICEAKTYIYYVDAVDLAHNHNTSVNGSFDVKKDDGCDCIESDECFTDSCLSYYLCAVPESPEFDINIMTTPENQFETRFEMPVGESKTLLLILRNPLAVPDTVTLEFDGNPDSLENWLKIDAPGSMDVSPSKREIIIDPKSEIRIPITIFAGKVGVYSLRMDAESGTTGQKTYNTTTFGIIYAEEGDLRTQSPGLNAFAVMLTLIIACFAIQRSGISH